MGPLTVTPSQTVGPFYGFALPYEGGAQLVGPDTSGAVRIEGRVLDGQGHPVIDALVEIWQADENGVYREAASEKIGGGTPGCTGFGRCSTDRQGSYYFVTVKPGRTLISSGLLQAPHLNVTIFARGLLRHLVTRMYFPDEAAANAADPVLNLIDDVSARATLVAHEDGKVLRFDLRLQGDQETVFFAI